MIVEERPFIHTDALGGVAIPSVDDLLAMHAGSYVLHARDGELTKVAVEKVQLPFDPKYHPQGGQVYMVSDDLIYAKQATLLCKSTDGGLTWTASEIEESKSNWHVLTDGTFIRIDMEAYDAKGPAEVFNSTDEGQSWHKIAEIPIEVSGGYAVRHTHWGISRLPDNTIFFGLDLRDENFSADKYMTASSVLTFYRSVDGGRTWEGPIKGSESSAEGGIAKLPSGRLLASIRYQRPAYSSESPYMRKAMGSGHAAHEPEAFKHHFLINSDDGGLTWYGLRPLTTVYGQTYGFPVSLTDGTVVVIHDARYPRHLDVARAMVSRDEGETWQDEVYYMYYGKGSTSYSRSVVLRDQTILTLAGTSTNPEARTSWDAAIGHSQMTAIRWRPIV